jgi:hypothetical protein
MVTGAPRAEHRCCARRSLAKRGGDAAPIRLANAPGSTCIIEAAGAFPRRQDNAAAIRTGGNQCGWTPRHRAGKAGLNGRHRGERSAWHVGRRASPATHRSWGEEPSVIELLTSKIMREPTDPCCSCTNRSRPLRELKRSLTSESGNSGQPQVAPPSLTVALQLSGWPIRVM